MGPCHMLLGGISDTIVFSAKSVSYQGKGERKFTILSNLSTVMRTKKNGRVASLVPNNYFLSFNPISNIQDETHPLSEPIREVRFY